MIALCCVKAKETASNYYSQSATLSQNETQFEEQRGFRESIQQRVSLSDLTMMSEFLSTVVTSIA